METRLTEIVQETPNSTLISNPEFISKALALYEEGYSACAVGRMLGTSHTPIRAILKAHNISTAPKKHWKGNQKGRRLNGRGYIEIFRPEHIHASPKSGYVKEHVFFACEQLGRPLKRNEVVHHLNGNKQDNRLKNLQVMTRSEHTRLHFHMSYLFQQEHFQD